MPHYAEDPIIEAVLGVRLTTSPSTVAGTIKEAAQIAFPDYPSSKPIPKLSGPDNDVDLEKDWNLSDTLGFALGQNSNKSIHLRLDEFSFHCEKPYQSWEAFFPEALRCWEKYKTIVDVVSIDGVFLRYVNRIELPRDVEDLSEYLTTAPNPVSLKGAKVSRRFSSFLADYKARGAHVIVNQLTLRKTISSLPYILDLDIHNHVDWNPDHNLESEFLRFRKLKNEVFEAMITDECRNLLKIERHGRNRRSL
jgi:uncharacterized protein (TIGR04255 family)